MTWYLFDCCCCYCCCCFDCCCCCNVIILLLLLLLLFLLPLVWAQTPSSGQTDFSRAFEGWSRPFIRDTSLVISLRSICWMLRCGSLEGARYLADDLVIAWEAALFVFVIIGCFMVFQTSSPRGFGKHPGGLPVGSMSNSSRKNSCGYFPCVVNPECCADCSCATAKHLQDKSVAQQQAGNLQDLTGGRGPALPG